ncbi:hypothetical protein U128_02425 [Anaplasma marginale str. Gypsy Plains]|nr:hypothetical protein U128_02425 [Anaplasma marginale str. Gypsy Plains]
MKAVFVLFMLISLEHVNTIYSIYTLTSRQFYAKM